MTVEELGSVLKLFSTPVAVLAIESLDPGPRVRRLANSYTREEMTLPEPHSGN